MITLEALVMVGLAAIAVYVAYTKLSFQPEDPRITWIPDAQDATAQDLLPDGNTAGAHR